MCMHTLLVLQGSSSSPPVTPSRRTAAAPTSTGLPGSDGQLPSPPSPTDESGASSGVSCTGLKACRVGREGQARARDVSRAQAHKLLSVRPGFLRPHLIPSSACLAAALLPAVALLRVLGQEGFCSLDQVHTACLAVPANAADVESFMSGA